MSRRDEYANAMGDIVAFNVLAMQLLVLTLERRGVIEVGDYAEAWLDMGCCSIHGSVTGSSQGAVAQRPNGAKANMRAPHSIQIV